jgi:hypothetical protein
MEINQSPDQPVYEKSSLNLLTTPPFSEDLIMMLSLALKR